MQFTPESILLSLFTAVVAALGSYFGCYVKAKAEMRAASEDLKIYLSHQIQLTSAIEGQKLKIATEGALAMEARQCIYSLVSVLHSLLHSMCWLAWNTSVRKSINRGLAELYDTEAHKGTPEIFARQALLLRLDPRLYEDSKSIIADILGMDVKIGDAIVLSENDERAAVALFSQLLLEALALKPRLDSTFGQQGN